MINQSDVERTFIDLLLAVDGASWNTEVGGETNRVYPAGPDYTGRPLPHVIVDCVSSDTSKQEIPDEQVMTAFQMTITCVAKFDQSTANAFWNKEILTGQVAQELIRNKITLKDYTDPENPVGVDSRDFRDYEVTDLIHHSVADKQVRASQEINGFIDAWQDKT